MAHTMAPHYVRIVQACCSAHRDTIYKTAKVEIIRCGQTAIKFGTITAAEVSNQIHAYEHLDARLCRVPRVLAWFQSEGISYLAMEYIDGEKRTMIDNSAISDVAKMVMHLHTLTSETPGPVTPDTYRGILWSEDEAVCFRKTQDLEAYVNSRLRRNLGNFTLEHSPLVFTHGDLSPRNLIFGDGYISLLDWEFAGYFPRTAEIAALRLGVGDSDSDACFSESLDRAILRDSPLSGPESLQLECWQELSVNHVRYYWPTEAEKATTKKKKRHRKRRHELEDRAVE